MRVLLIQSCLGRREPPVAPLGLAVIAANIEHHDISIIDPNILPLPVEDTLRQITDYSPDVIGVSLRNIDTTKYSDQFLYYIHFKEFIRSISAVKGDAPLVLGGSGFSLFPERIMETVPEADFGFVQEADLTFAGFLDGGLNPLAVKGVYYREGGVKFSGSPEPPDLETLKTPRWDLLEMEKYARYSAKASVGIEAKRGCALSCAYCTYPNLAGGKLRMKSAVKVVDEIEELLGVYPVEKVYFTDPVFNHPVEHAESICREIIRRDLKIKWGGYLQDRFFSRAYMESAIESGCDDFYFSPDAATGWGMKSLNKSSTSGSLNESLRLIKSEKRAKTAYNFFAAFPGSGWRDLLSAIVFLAKAKIILGRRMVRFKLSYIRLEPDTETLKKTGDTSKLRLLPESYRELDKLFYRKTRSKLLDILLKLHYHIGSRFGKRNTL